MPRSVDALVEGLICFSRCLWRNRGGRRERGEAESHQLQSGAVIAYWRKANRGSKAKAVVSRKRYVVWSTSIFLTQFCRARLGVSSQDHFSLHENQLWGSSLRRIGVSSCKMGAELRPPSHNPYVHRSSTRASDCCSGRSSPTHHKRFQRRRNCEESVGNPRRWAPGGNHAARAKASA